MKEIKEENNNMEQLILNAAEELFLEKGFGLTSTTEIAAKAGCNQALVHYYYRTKSNLFEIVFANKVELFLEIFTSIDNEDLSFEEKLKKKIIAHFDVLNKNPRLPYLLINELTANPQRIKEIKNVFKDTPKILIENIDRELKPEISAGRIRNISALDLLFTIVSMNIFLFVAKPMINAIFESQDNIFDNLVEHRKKEIVETIISSLRP